MAGDLRYEGKYLIKNRDKALRPNEVQIAAGQKENPEIAEISGFYGCGGRTRTYGLRVMSSKIFLSVRVRWCLFVSEIKHSGVLGVNYCVGSCWFVSVGKKHFVDKLLLKNWWGIFISKSPHWGNFGGILPPKSPSFYRVYSPRRFKG